jgi:hypothetical protein
LAAKAEAIMTIGQRTWYEKDKVMTYINSKEKKDKEVKEMKEIPQIEWFSRMTPGGTSITCDVRITMTKDGRFRASFDRNRLASVKLGKRMMVGISGEKMYFAYSDEGYSVGAKEKGIVSIQCKARGGMEKFVGEYPIHIGLNGLINIDLKERKEIKLPTE